MQAMFQENLTQFFLSHNISNISIYDSNFTYDYNNRGNLDGVGSGYSDAEYLDYYNYYNENHSSCQENNSHWYSIPGYVICIHILLPIICVVGIVGILLTVIVLSRKSMSTSTNSYLIAVAVTDLCFLITMFTKCLETKLTREQHYMYLIFMTYTHQVLMIFVLASVWLTVMLAVERYIAICHPLRAMSICTVIRARLIIAIIFIIATLYRLPHFFKFEISTFYDFCIKKDMIWHEVGALGNSPTFKEVYNWADCFLLVIIPFTALLYLNICLIREIRRSTNYLRYHLASDSNVQTIITSEEIKITMMLISVIVVFFVSQAPFLVLGVLKRLLPTTTHVFMYYHILTFVTILLLVLRSSCNFVVYCWFSEKFWSTFKEVFCMPSCLLSHTPSWLRSRVIGHNSEHGIHSNSNNNRKISNIYTKETIC